MKIIDTKDIKYRCSRWTSKSKSNRSVEVIGMDTEAYQDGFCFMIATSEGDVFGPEDFPQCFFSRKYIGRTFVTYNLSYDEGALLQNLPAKILKQLWDGDTVEYQGFSYFVIPKKCITVSRNKRSIHIFDMYNFYEHSLDFNAEKYLGEKKIEQDVKKFLPDYVRDHWDQISEYCVRDAELVRRLAELLIRKFEKFGIFPKKLYSTAYISFQYFRKKTNYVVVKRYWEDYREVLDFAMRSYNGGKFEVTEKGSGYLWEYDIISAYPHEIANLQDISHARVVRSAKYRAHAAYGFLKCRLEIPVEVVSPVAVKYGKVNTYPAGHIEKTVTKKEYDYLLRAGCEIDILDGFWLHLDRRVYPYRHEIRKLMVLKARYKQEKKDLDYHTIKIFLNSLYGKFLQLIDKKDYYQASMCWNPIYGAIVTANVRIRMSELQQRYPSIMAVHTDSVLSKSPLPFPESGEMGDMIMECEGDGVIVGSGVYQIGKKTKFRGFDIKTPLLKLIDTDRDYISLWGKKALTWRAVIFHGWSTDMINRFQKSCKKVYVNFDTKRIWLDDYMSFREILKRNVISVPHHSEAFLL